MSQSDISLKKKSIFLYHAINVALPHAWDPCLRQTLYWSIHLVGGVGGHLKNCVFCSLEKMLTIMYGNNRDMMIIMQQNI